MNSAYVECMTNNDLKTPTELELAHDAATHNGHIAQCAKCGRRTLHDAAWEFGLCVVCYAEVAAIVEDEEAN